MGGHAFPHYNAIRLNKDDYEIFSQQILSKLHSINDSFQIIPSYRLKESFGDIDIIFINNLKISIGEFQDKLGAISTVCNGNIYSFAIPISSNHDIFQVDLIGVPINEYESSISYFSFNDLGNLIGKISRRMGFKLGHRGLTYMVRDEENSSHNLKEIVITSSWKEAIEFLGYDFNRWEKGFDSLEDIFQYAVSNPLANKIIFDLNETSHIARVRDRKRLTYQKFLLWINDPINNVPENETISKKELRKIYIKKAFDTFPLFQEEYKRVQNELQICKLVKEKFNGDFIYEWTGLKGKELGEFITLFTNNVIKLNKNEWVLNHSIDEIKEMVCKFQKREYNDKCKNIL